MKNKSVECIQSIHYVRVRIQDSEMLAASIGTVRNVAGGFNSAGEQLNGNEISTIFKIITADV